MRNILLMIVVLLQFFAPLVSGERIELGTNVNDINVIVEESTPVRTVVRFDIGAFNKDIININGENYNTISCGKEGILLNKGEPALPRICRSVIIPDDAKVKINILSSKYIDFQNTPIIPSKGNLLRTVNPKDIPYTFGPVYNKSEWYPQELAAAREPYILRDYRGAVIELNAFQYNPGEKTLRVYSSVTIEIINDGPGEINVLNPRAHADKLVPDFDILYKNRFINYNMAQKYISVMESGDMLIITHDAFHTTMDPFVAWKMQKGIKTTIIDVSAIGNNSSSIQSFIQSFYDSTNLAWVLLVGDHMEVATPFASGGASDPSYAKV
ncbi:MAG: C25 family peptidase propeptide domain-containing protein, partial [Candidatus Zixiibacteriota bacterium]